MAKETIAVFDFDGTITTRDSLLPFLFFTHPWQAWLKLFWLTPTFILFLAGLKSRQQVKEKILTSFYQRLPLSQLEALGAEYAKTKLEKIVKSEAIKKINWHIQNGHPLFIVSASIETYLKPWGKIHGFTEVLGSKLDIDTHHLIKGTLLGANCRGAEKRVRLYAALPKPREQYIIYAYGDSAGDKELLELSDYSFYCNFN